MKKMFIVLASTILFAGCWPLSSTPSSSSSTPGPAVTSSPVTQTQASPLSSPTLAANVRVVDISGKNFSYDQMEIRAKKGEALAIKFDNEGGMHNLVIDGLNVETPVIKTGETSTIIVPTDKTGTYVFYCSVNTHREKGMEGKLIIE